jgi:S-(hydroxymethyl)glutathione dehydrogenase / alcohol dehydrogenase
VQAVICSEIEQRVEVEVVSLPPLEGNDVRIATGASGVCHSDLSMVKGWTGQRMPMVLGHEGAGTVVELGKHVTRCKVGDRVIVSWAPTCGVCWHCVRHEAQHCDHIPQINGSHSVLRQDGSRVTTMAGLGTFSEMMQVSELSVVPVRTDLPTEQLAMIGCGVTTGVGAALWTAGVKPASSVAVFGLGGVGLSVVQGARIAGAIRIFGVDPLVNKREIASRFGATDLIDPAAGDVVEQLTAATQGRGVDYAFDVVGQPLVAMQAFNSVRKRGTTVIVGMANRDAVATIPLVPILLSEKRIIGSKYGSVQVREHFPLLVEFAERGMLDLASMISRRISLADVNEAFSAMEAGDVVRSVIRFGHS